MLTRDDAYRAACHYSWRAPVLSLRYATYVVLNVVGSALCRRGWAVRYRASKVFERLVNAFPWDDGAETE